MFGDMMDKLQEMKQQMEDTKNRLNDLTVTASVEDGRIEVTATGNRRIKSLKIADELMSGDREELEDLLIVALNQAMEKADELHEKEMGSVAKFNFPGLDL